MSLSVAVSSQTSQISEGILSSTQVNLDSGVVSQDILEVFTNSQQSLEISSSSPKRFQPCYAGKENQAWDKFKHGSNNYGDHSVVERSKVEREIFDVSTQSQHDVVSIASEDCDECLFPTTSANPGAHLSPKHESTIEEVYTTYKTKSESLWSCPLCCGFFPNLSSEERTIHANACLNSNLHPRHPKAHSQDTTTNTDAIRQQVYSCPVCLQLFENETVSLETVIKRLKHVKKCGTEHGVTPRDLRHLRNAPVEEASKVTTAKAEFDDRIPGLLFACLLDAIDNDDRDEKRTMFDVLMQGNDTQAFVKKNESTIRPSYGTVKRVNVYVKPAHKGNAKRKSFQGFRRKDWTSCPSYKRVQGTDLIVDGFQYADRRLSARYILTHFHSDHYGGLSSKFDAGAILCTLETAKLVQQQLGVSPHYIRVVKYNQTTVLDDTLRITAIDANHCPGAAMFLIEHSIGNGIIRRHLHTGDFRFSRDMLEHPKLAHLVQSNLQTKLQKMIDAPVSAAKESTPFHILDSVYLDTTYCDPKYQFPDQITILEQIRALVEDTWSPLTIYQCGTYSIGKEKIFMKVAETVDNLAAQARQRDKPRLLRISDGESKWWDKSNLRHQKLYQTRTPKGLAKIYLPREKLRILRNLNWSKDDFERFTSKKEEAMIWVIPMSKIRLDLMETALRALNGSVTKLISIRPTGWSFTSNTQTIKPVSNSTGTCKIYSIPYSEHSSFNELQDFIKAFKPKDIISTVPGGVRKHILSLKKI